MENTALNDTTTTKDQDWKQKKGYGPIIAMSLALLLGLSFYLGGHLGGDTTLYRDKKEMQNVAASSSSTSLMGSGTAASDLKTLTIAVDDDKLIDGLLSGWLPKGGGNAGGDVIPIGGYCYEAPEDCAIPLGMTHPNCLCSDSNTRYCLCESGQPGAPCAKTSDCVKPPGLEHPVCRYDGGSRTVFSCQSGQPGSLCGVTDDCVVPPGLEHAVCRKDRCQQ